MMMRVLACVLAGAPAALFAAPATASADWMQTATRADRGRIHDWRDAFVKALGEARTSHAADVTREGVLLNADAALPNPVIPAGNFACRTIKLGNQGSEGLAYVAYQPFKCRIIIGKKGKIFSKIDGSQRPSGRLFAVEDRRQVFLGTLALGDETRPIEYGRDIDRDMAGIVERIGVNRWRLVLPYPRFESTLDVIELIPSN